MKQIVQNYKTGEIGLEEVPPAICKAGRISIHESGPNTLVTPAPLTSYSCPGDSDQNNVRDQPAGSALRTEE